MSFVIHRHDQPAKLRGESLNAFATKEEASVALAAIVTDLIAKLSPRFGIDRAKRIAEDGWSIVG